MSYWHGGSRIAGDFVLPSHETGRSRSGDEGVFVTTDRSLAEMYASTVAGPSWVYRCGRARILRRFTVSNAARRANRIAVGLAERAIG